MKDIYCDLIERYNEIGSGGPEADEKILAGTEDGFYFHALSPDRVNAAEKAMPWAESMLQKQQCRRQSQCRGRVNAADRGNR